MKDVIQHVESGLQDLCVSRPAERLSWGIPVPEDASQTIYVWLDALINYLTKANYPFPVPGEEKAGGWPANCHVIGKDIVRCVHYRIIQFPILAQCLQGSTAFTGLRF